MCTLIGCANFVCKIDNEPKTQKSNLSNWLDTLFDHKF